MDDAAESLAPQAKSLLDLVLAGGRSGIAPQLRLRAYAAALGSRRRIDTNLVFH